MKIIAVYEELNFPAWALCALVNGDDSGMTDEEIEQVDTFVAEWSRVAKESGGEYFGQETFGEPSFCHYPEFGMPCDCIELTVYIWGKQTKGANKTMEFKIKPEWCDTPTERDLVYIILEDRGSEVLARVKNNPFGFAIEPVETFEKRMINLI